MICTKCGYDETDKDEQKPVAWMNTRNGFISKESKNPDYNAPLYLVPRIDPTPSVPVWLTIDSAPSEDRKMFVVRAFNVINGFTNGKPYTTDPWCVWRNEDGSFARWPHHFAPTHWMPLPEVPQPE